MAQVNGYGSKITRRQRPVQVAQNNGTKGAGDTVCIPQLTQRKPRITTVKLGRHVFRFGLSIDPYFRNVSAVWRGRYGRLRSTSLGAKMGIDRQRRGLVVNGKLISGKALRSEKAFWKALKKFIRPQIDVFMAARENENNSRGLDHISHNLSRIDGKLSRLKKQHGRRFYRHPDVKKVHKDLTKQSLRLGTYLRSLRKQRAKILKISRGKNQKREFKAKIQAALEQNAALMKKLSGVRAKLFKIQSTYWPHVYKTTKPC